MRRSWQRKIGNVAACLIVTGIMFAGTPLTAALASCGLTSWYGNESGSHTASGQRFHPEGLTAAHRTLPFGTRLTVCRQTGTNNSAQHGACVTVVVNDRGPAKWTGRNLDLSKGAARVLGMIQAGVVRTCWE